MSAVLIFGPVPLFTWTIATTFLHCDETLSILFQVLSPTAFTRRKKIVSDGF